MSGKSEEFRKISGRASWALIIGFCLVIVAWGYFNYWLIPDAPRQWDLGQLPEAPGQSIYTSTPTPTQYTLPGVSPRTVDAPRQIPPLPEARPPKPSALSETPPLVTWPTSSPATERPGPQDSPVPASRPSQSMVPQENCPMSIAHCPLKGSVAIGNRQSAIGNAAGGGR